MKLVALFCLVSFAAACGGASNVASNSSNVVLTNANNANAAVNANVQPMASLTPAVTNANSSAATPDQPIPLGTPAKFDPNKPKVRKPAVTPQASNVPTQDEIRRLMSGAPAPSSNVPMMKGAPMMKPKMTGNTNKP